MTMTTQQNNGPKYHFVATHHMTSTGADGKDIEIDVMAVAVHDEVWLYTESEATIGADEPLYVGDVKKMPRDGIVTGQMMKLHRRGKAVKNASLRRLAAIIDFQTNGPGLTAREVDDAKDYPVKATKPAKTDRLAKIAAATKTNPKQQGVKKAKTAAKAPKVEPAKPTLALVPPAVETDDEEGVDADERVERAISESLVENVDAVGIAPEAKVESPKPAKTARAPKTPSTGSFIAAALELMKAGPQKVGDMAKTIVDQNLVPGHKSAIPGRTLWAEILRHEKKGAIVRVAPGTYALAGDGVVAAARTARVPGGKPKARKEPTMKLTLTDALAILDDMSLDIELNAVMSEAAASARQRLAMFVESFRSQTSGEIKVAS